MGKYANYAAALIFLVFAATLSPWGYDFPLNDDWAYALAARALAATGRLTLSDWGASTQLPHIITGAVFAKAFGFSFSHSLSSAFTSTAMCTAPCSCLTSMCLKGES